jgi:hypothetical protein
MIKALSSSSLLFFLKLLSRDLKSCIGIMLSFTNVHDIQ